MMKIIFISRMSITLIINKLLFLKRLLNIEITNLINMKFYILMEIYILVNLLRQKLKKDLGFTSI